MSIPFRFQEWTHEAKPIITVKTHAGDDNGSVEQQNDPGPGASLTNPIPDTPQPASLGTLAMGSRALSIWQRKELPSPPEELPFLTSLTRASRVAYS